jgi:hypothetical protein
MNKVGPVMGLVLIWGSGGNVMSHISFNEQRLYEV